MAKIFALLLLCIVPASAFGAVVPTISLRPVISANPSYQTPNASVVLTAIAKVPKGEVTYTWTVDDVEIARGIDIDKITLTAGAGGSTKVVRVFLVDAQGAEGEALYLIRPGSVDLVWEGNTYIPPLYAGKALPTGDSMIQVQALPHIEIGSGRVPKNSLVYTWEVEGQKLEAASGFGKSVLRIKPTKLKYQTRVSVTASTPDGTIGARASATIPLYNPVVVIYEEKPLSGTWYTQATPAMTTLSADEVAFRAIPYFVLDPKSVSFVWTLSGEPFEIDTPDRSIAVFRKTGEGAGEYPVGVTIEKRDSLFERASSRFVLSF
ncbi:hypothetical protein K2P56_04035 [Patescibacteria group bacterium]|nr:hypothetical protein [Patescibacteria group bacterium]